MNVDPALRGIEQAKLSPRDLVWPVGIDLKSRLPVALDFNR
jgi:hypothetical protein